MKLSLFDYSLPKERIAQEPARPRDTSRLLELDRKTGRMRHRVFADIVDSFHAGDVLVLNDTKVFPARLIGRKPTGGKVEVFLLRPVNARTWECLVRGKGSRTELRVYFSSHNAGGARLHGVVTQFSDGMWRIRFNLSGRQLQAVINKIGQVPTPPYIKRQSNLKEYQTVFATKTGSVAAPTAGFHFTKRLLAKLERKGVQIEQVTLHVGYGTFAPVKVDDVRKHVMHAEWIEVSAAVHKRLLEAKRSGRRIIAVGTTAVRTLESFPRRRRWPPYRARGKQYSPTKAWIQTFILPGYRFKLVDGMITNFHLPKSTLLMLVSAFAGREHILRAYREAVRKKYRFYSFGDAMLII